MSSTPPFTSAQPRESVLATEIEDLSSSDSVYEDSDTDIEGIESELNNKSKRSELPASTTGQSVPSSTSEVPKNKRFRPSTWLNQTAGDRAISDSLDQLRARDLSIHLFNAHSLKKRAPLVRSKTEDSSENNLLWKPPKHWTAWPLASDEVPKLKKEIWADVEDGELTSQSLNYPDGPGAELCEQLIEVVLKTARERFLAEDFRQDTNMVSVAPGRTDDGYTSASRSRAGSESESSVFNSSVDSDEEIRHPSSEVPIGDGAEDTPLFDDIHHSSASDRQPPSKLKGRNDSRNLPNNTSPSNDPRLRSLKPAIMADEELASSILQPSLRHILSKLDTLLRGLHHARRASLRVNDDSASETQTDMDDDGSRAPSSARTRSRSAHSRKRSISQRRTSRSHSQAASASVGSDTSTSSYETSSRQAGKRARRSSSPRLKARRFRRRRDRMGLRDWSDVLGVAAMQGWDRKVIDAAAGRCAALFGEGMDFRVVDGLDVDDFSYLPTGIKKKT